MKVEQRSIIFRVSDLMAIDFSANIISNPHSLRPTKENQEQTEEKPISTRVNRDYPRDKMFPDQR